MLPRAHRLRRSSDLQRLWQRGKAFRHPLATLMIRSNFLDVSRFAFVAGRRVGGAVARNRAKRLLREVVRRHLAEIDSGWDILLVARRETAGASYHEIDEAVGNLMRESRLLRGSDSLVAPDSAWPLRSSGDEFQ